MIYLYYIFGLIATVASAMTAIELIGVKMKENDDKTTDFAIISIICATCSMVLALFVL